MNNHLPALPSVARYVTGLRQLLHDPTSSRYAMLQAQFRAPNYTITATELAQAAGFKDWRGANLQYGLMGKRLRELINYWEDEYLTGETQASYILSRFYPPGTQGNHDWLFVMHDEVAEALKRLGWK